MYVLVREREREIERERERRSLGGGMCVLFGEMGNGETCEYTERGKCLFKRGKEGGGDCCTTLFLSFSLSLSLSL